MADPLSIASGIAGIITLAGSIVSSTYKYAHAVKGAFSETRALMDEIMSLTGVLTAVKSLLETEANPEPPAYSELPPDSSSERRMGRFAELGIEESIQDTRVILSTIEESLKKAIASMSRRGVPGAFNKLIWPLKHGDTLTLVERLERKKAVFMCALGAANISINIEVKNAIEDVKRNQERDSCERRMDKLNARQRKIFKWLSTVDCATIHASASRLRLPKTGTWMLNSQLWYNWLEAKSSFLWLYGIAGSGKTILTSTLIEECRSHFANDETFLAYFYCDFREKETQKEEAVLGSLICQLSMQFDTLPPQLEEFARMHEVSGGQLTSPSLEDLQRLFLGLLEECPSSAIVLDGLDECRQRSNIVPLLSNIATSTEYKTKVLISSRQEGDLEQTFGKFAHQSTRVHAVDNDIEYYISNSIATKHRLQRLPEALQEEIMKGLQAQALGMFRYVQCQIEELDRLRTPRDIRQALKRLPRDINETYARSLDKIEDHDREVARRALSWLCQAAEPPTLSELAEAAIIEPGMTTLDPDMRWFPQDLLDIIGGLISYSAEDDIITLAHHSVKEYLESDAILARNPFFHITPKMSNHSIATTCLTYLLLSEFSEAGDSQTLDIRFEDYPLLLYSSRYWPYHAKPHLESSPEILNLAGALLHPSRTPNFRHWAESMIIQGRFSFRPTIDSRSPRRVEAKIGITRTNTQSLTGLCLPKLTPLYYAASFGLTPIVEQLLASGVNPNEPGGVFGGTPLHAAVFRQHCDVAKLLVKAGAKTDTGDGTGVTPHDMTRVHVCGQEMQDLITEASKSQTTLSSWLFPAAKPPVPSRLKNRRFGH